MTLVFDICKTNKKAVVFSEKLEVVHESSELLPETVDEDGDPCEDLDLLCHWTDEQLATLTSQYPIDRVNFSTYGASFVYVDADGRPTAPLYNYLKAIDTSWLTEVYREHGGPQAFHANVGSPPLGALNSGFQVEWFRRTRPEAFAKTCYALHLPQYLSYRLTGRATSDFTSVGCHTALWDFPRNRYHDWVVKTGLLSVLPLPQRPILVERLRPTHVQNIEQSGYSQQLDSNGHRHGRDGTDKLRHVRNTEQSMPGQQPRSSAKLTVVRAAGEPVGVTNVDQPGFDDTFGERTVPSTEARDIRSESLLIGSGVHDSSAALVPYLARYADPFVLLSTGTWAIALNPWNHEPLTTYELSRDCLTFMQPDGSPVKASRLFLGFEHDAQVHKLTAAYGVARDAYKRVAYSRKLDPVGRPPSLAFTHLHSSLRAKRIQPVTDATFEQAYHRLVRELVDLQLSQLDLVVARKELRLLIVDGGFSKNTLFVTMLSDAYPHARIELSATGNGSALGAAILVNNPERFVRPEATTA